MKNAAQLESFMEEHMCWHQLRDAARELKLPHHGSRDMFIENIMDLFARDAERVRQCVMRHHERHVQRGTGQKRRREGSEDRVVRQLASAFDLVASASEEEPPRRRRAGAGPSHVTALTTHISNTVSTCASTGSEEAQSGYREPTATPARPLPAAARPGELDFFSPIMHHVPARLAQYCVSI